MHFLFSLKQALTLIEWVSVESELYDYLLLTELLRAHDYWIQQHVLPLFRPQSPSILYIRTGKHLLKGYIRKITKRGNKTNEILGAFQLCGGHIFCWVDILLVSERTGFVCTKLNSKENISGAFVESSSATLVSFGFIHPIVVVSVHWILTHSIRFHI